MKHLHTVCTGFLHSFRQQLPIALALLMSFSATGLFAEANYVYHEQTTSNPGCGPNYMSTTSPTNAASVQLGWKIEYQFYTTNTVVYYTTDGSTPSGAFGIPSGSTQAIAGSYNCTFGAAVDVATATIPVQPAGTTVKYIIGAWHSGGGDEIFANGPGAPCACGTPTNNSSLATVFSYTVTNSNNVEVVATAGTAIASYATLKAAFDAIHLGTHQGTININIWGNTTETATAQINASGGAVSYTSITIAPKGAARTITGSIVGAIIKLNGADNVTIDGRIGGVGNNLTVSNTNTSSLTAAIWLSSVGIGAGTTNNIVRNLNIACGVDQSTSTSSTYGIILSGTTISATSNAEDSDNNQFLYNNITKCRYGILTRGSTTNLNSGIVISNNTIGPLSFGSNQIGKAGIFMQGETGAIVNGNTVQFVGGAYANTTGGADRMGIAIGTESWSTAPGTYTSNTYTVTNNIIHDIIEERTFSAVGINLGTTGGGSATNNIVANNMIYNVKANGTVGDQTVGLGIAGGHTDKVVFNSIYLSGDVDPNPSASASTNYGSGIRIANANGTTHLNLTLMNNVVYMDLSSSSGPTVRYYAISGNSAAYSFGTGGENYNAYYINPANTQLMTGGLGSASGVTLTTQFATLANWQAAYTIAQDANSIADMPLFVSSTDLHMQSSGSNGPFNGTGISIAGVTTDYDGESRGGSPDRGADEFSIPVCETADGGAISPTSASICAGLTYGMSSTGATSGDGIVYQWEVSSTGGGVGFADVVGGTGATATSYTTAAMAEGTYYFRLKVNCVPAGLTDYSNEFTLTVNPTPTASAASNSPLCEGEDILLSGTTDIGSTYSWTGPGGYASASEDPVIASAVLASAGTYSFTASAGGCTSTIATTIVVVNPNPTGVTANAAPPSVCEGAPINLTSTANPLGYTMNPAGVESFFDISGTGTSVGVLADDSEHNITLPSFSFNGVAYTSARVGNNGVIALGSTTGDVTTTNAILPSTANTAGNIFLAPWWDDLDIDFTGELISTETVGSKFIIQYTNLSHFSYATGGVTFQVQLDLLSGAIHYVYSDVIFGSATYDAGASATIGIQLNSTTATQYSFNTASLTNGQCITFTPNLPDFSWSGPDAFSSALQNPTIASATPGAAGIYTVTVTNLGTGCSTTASTGSVTVEPNVTYYQDFDGDTYGNAAVTMESCTGAPVGFVSDNTDCVDANAFINPGATEVCDNAVDDDCDGFIDEDCATYTYYADTDEDTYGDALNSIVSASPTPPAGYVVDDQDCDDADPAINPGATEICNAIDEDCDGTADDGLVFDTWYADADDDGYGNAAVSASTCDGAPAGYVGDDSDCDDSDAAINPGATEICNAIDDDCDGIADDGLTFLDYYTDNDGDSYGDYLASPVNSCSPVAGSVTNNEDCNDSNNLVNPDGTEICNGVDDDCDGTVDDGIIYEFSYGDGDDDGYGDPLVIISTCDGPPAGYVSNDDDCDDDNAAINPGATEICNAVDDDCDGTADDGLTFTTYYSDNDGDGYGNATYGTTSTCDGITPVGYSTTNDDCNPLNAAINPGATEICNGIDDDCDASTDEGLVFDTWYADADGDGYGNAAVSTSTCDGAPAGYVGDDSDCDDGSAAINPGATEICNDIDDDCDGTPDDGLVFDTWYADGDDDGYGNAAVSTSTCDGAPAGYVGDDSDCDDSDAAINPGATEICNGIDDDCDASTDEGLVFDTWYADADDDGYGNAAVSTSTCDGAPSGYVADNTDCHDGNAAINPGATEICNGVDDNCDGNTDDGLITAVITAGGPTTFCQGESVLLSANTGEGYTYQWKVGGSNIPGATSSTLNANKSGSITVVITIPGGCSDVSDPVITTRLARPVSNVINADATNDLCFDASIKLKANLTTGVTYQWWRGGLLLAGETNYLYFATTPGNYRIQQTSTATGCYSVSPPYSIIQTCRDGELVNSDAVENSISVYPNPAENEFTIEVTIATSENEALIGLYNLMGDLVYTGTAVIENGAINEHIVLSDAIASGLYVVKITSGSTELTSQVLIQK